MSLKDLVDQAGVPTTAASLVRRGHVATGDAPVTSRLRAAGAVFVGKTNLHEFAFGTTSEDSGYGAARHPLDPSRSPGGSSGGSAISVATGMALASVGTDTGGSIRIPSAACGIVGLKAGWGEVPAEGVVPLSRQLDHVGPMTRSVDDAWLLYDVMRDAAAGEPPRPADLRALRIGVPRGHLFDRLDEEVDRLIAAAIESVASAGAAVSDTSIPHAGETPIVYLPLVLADGAEYHAPMLETRPGDYTPNVRARLEMGRYVMAEDYVRAQRLRARLRREVDAALAEVDVLALPALAIPAPPLGAADVPVKGGREPVRAVMLRCTQLFNITGHPAISLPCGLTKHGLPVGLQLVGRRGATPALLAAAAAVEARLAPA
jgi:aspartyl-tRNA(Asn)/glutamyl-tRNA(Gln) amidotransferase subunit A